MSFHIDINDYSSPMRLYEWAGKQEHLRHEQWAVVLLTACWLAWHVTGTSTRGLSVPPLHFAARNGKWSAARSRGTDVWQIGNTGNNTRFATYMSMAITEQAMLYLQCTLVFLYLFERTMIQCSISRRRAAVVVP